MQTNLPSEAQLIQQIHSLINLNRLDQASQLCTQLIKRFPKFADGWMTKSFISARSGRYDEALVSINKAIRLAPRQESFKFQKIMLLEQMGQLSKSFKLGRELLTINLKDKQVIMSLAAFFYRHQKFDLVKNCYYKALQLDPENQAILLNLATVTLFLGDLDEAEKLATKALRGNDFDSDVHFFRSNIRKQDKLNNHIEELKSLNSKNIKDPEKKAKGLYALAKELEDCGEYEESFSFRAKGAEVYRKSLKYNFREDINFLRSLRETYSSELLDKISSSQKRNESKAPIFIVGLPRTGTTLLERVVSSHSDVFAAGELPHFSRLMSVGMEQLGLSSNLSRDKMVAASSKLNFGQLGHQYLKICESMEYQKKYFIDKFPQNSLYAGLIHLALPNARMLLLERHPLDVCYSVYKQLFTEAFQFSYDLEELAEYYFEHQQLMEHWKSVLPTSLKTVRYESLVENFETTAKDVIDFCGLEWQESCLEFHNNKQPTTTASAGQVRQKVYSSSIGMWKNYRNELQPLIKKLESYGCLEGWDY